MLRSISRKLAIDSLRKEKRNTFFILGVAIMAVVTISLTTIIFSTYKEIQKQENIKKLGSWQYIVENCDVDLETEIRNHQETDSLAKIAISGNMTYRDSSVTIASFEHMDTMSNYGIKQGKYPKDGEVAISEKTLAMLGYSTELGQTITLTYQNMNGDTITEQRILSGIVEHDVMELTFVSTSKLVYIKNLYDIFNPTIEMSEYALPSIIISDAPVNSRYMLFVKLKSKDMTLQSSILKQEDLQLQNDVIYTIRNTLEKPYRIVFNSAYTVSVASNVYAGMFQFMVYVITLVITLTVVLGTTLATLKMKEKEFALLRGIGQTKRQLRAMLFYQTFFICLLAIPLGLLITAILTIVGNMIFVNSTGVEALTYNPNELLYSILAVVAVIFIATYIPAKKASRRALSGAFDEEEFHRIQIRYRKLKKQTPRRLAFRELIDSRAGTIVVILILAFTFVSVTNVLDYQESYQSYKQIYQQAKKDKEVSFIIDDEVGKITSGLSQEEVEQIQNITNQVGYTRQVADEEYFELFWDGIEKEDTLFSRLIMSSISRYYYISTAKSVVMSRHLDNKYMQESMMQSLEGRLPEADHEIVVYLPYLKYQKPSIWTASGQVKARSKEDGDYNCHIDTISLGETIYTRFNDEPNIESYTVVGIVHEVGKTYWMPAGSITMMFTEQKYNDIYNKMKVQEELEDTNEALYSSVYCKLETSLQKEALLTKLKALQETHPDMKIVDEQEVAKNMLDNYQDQYYTSIMKATAISLISFFLYYYISRFKILFTIKRIGLLKSIGASDKQIYIMTMWKMGYCIIAALVLSQWTVVYGLVTRVPIQYYQYPYIIHFLLTAILVIISLIVYCIPLRKILKRDIIENISYYE